jgi:hypothetical protein
VNDARQNKASVKITPTGGEASYEAAEVFEGIIRRIEYQSKAIDAYSTGIYHQVESGLGFVTVDLDYVNDNGFDLEIFIRRVGDPDSIYFDPDCEEYDKSDMSFAFHFEDIPREVWDAEHGENSAPPPTPLDYHADSWVTRDHVRVAQFWRRVQKDGKLHQLRDGRTIRDSDMDDAQSEALTPLIDRTRNVFDTVVKWYRIEGNEITDEGTWPGKHIPIVPFIGEESVIDGVLDRKGHTRSQIDAQRIYNYWASAAVEQVALQSKTPYIADLRAIENLENYWYSANTKNWAVLPYNGVSDQGTDIPPPARQQPPDMAQAYVQGMTIARQDLLDVTGQYQAELGMPSNERSGVAIQQRQRQGDNATYHYIDNQAKAIRQVGRILLDLIPKVYDTTRVMKIMAKDGSDSDVVLAPTAPQAHMRIPILPNGQPMLDQNGQPQSVNQDTADMINADDRVPDVRVIFNPTLGDYGVEADVGPSFGTQRQEAANAFVQIMAQNPNAFAIVGDLWAENSDFPGADELAARLKKGLPPQYKPGPDPQMVQLQQAAQQHDQMTRQLMAKADAQIATLSAHNVRLKEQNEDKRAELAIKDYSAETDRLKAVGQIDPHALQIVVRRLLQDMIQTDIIPHLQRHAQIQGDIQQTMAPPEPQDGADNGNGAAQPTQ